MTDAVKAPSARRAELLELAYDYVLAEGLAGMSLRPLAAAIGSSPLLKPRSMLKSASLSAE